MYTKDSIVFSLPFLQALRHKDIFHGFNVNENFVEFLNE